MQNHSKAVSFDLPDVQVYSLNLALPAADVLALRQLLSVDELARAKRFHFERDRRRYIVARGTLRQLLGEALALPPQRVRFCYSAYGKPAIVNEQNSHEVRFNVSHSGECAVYAITYGRNVGVDVEEVRHLDDFAAMAAHFFSERENQALAAVSQEVWPTAFFNCWTRKEAYIKARGEGLSLPLDSFDVTLQPGHPARLLAVRHHDGTRSTQRENEREIIRWQMQELDVGTEYIAALVVENPTIFGCNTH